MFDRLEMVPIGQRAEGGEIVEIRWSGPSGRHGSIRIVRHDAQGPQMGSRLGLRTAADWSLPADPTGQEIVQPAM